VLIAFSLIAGVGPATALLSGARLDGPELDH
jgi:hypothetical protein